jgi:small basic protein
MLFILSGIVVGILIGYLSKFGIYIDSKYSIYMLLLILAIVNSIFTLITKKNIDNFKISYCFIYIFIDIIIAVGIGFLSDKLGLPLYLAAIFAFGNNIYKNLSLLVVSLVQFKKS